MISLLIVQEVIGLKQQLLYLLQGYNNQNVLGQTLMGIGDANHQRRLQAETFNKDTDATNQRMDMMAQQSNAQNRQYGLRNLMALAEMK